MIIGRTSIYLGQAEGTQRMTIPAHAPIDPGTILYVKDWLTLVALLLGPIIAVLITLWHQDRFMRRSAKQRLFAALMASRKSRPPTADWTNGVNLIDVVFADDHAVVQKWHDLYIILETKPWNQTRYNHGVLELLFEMAKALGYKNLKQTDIDKFYSPVAHGNQATRQDQMQDEFLRVLRASKNFSEPNA